MFVATGNKDISKFTLEVIEVCLCVRDVPIVISTMLPLLQASNLYLCVCVFASASSIFHSGQVSRIEGHDELGGCQNGS